MLAVLGYLWGDRQVAISTEAEAEAR
jgi:hypothetical protein